MYLDILVDGRAEFCVIAGILWHKAGVRFVLHFPHQYFILVTFTDFPDKITVALQVWKAATGTPGIFFHFDRVGVFALPVGKRITGDADEHFTSGHHLPVDFCVPVPFIRRSIGILPVFAIPILDPCRSLNVSPAQVFM